MNATPLRLAFAGTPDFAMPSLLALIESGHPVVCVLTQPDRRSGRGRRLAPPPIKSLALEHGLRVEQPSSLRTPESIAMVDELDLDLLIVVAYGQILPQSVLGLPRLGCWNVHGSLLPRWRGAAPVQRAIMAGDQDTGITLMQMDAGLDTGPMLLQSSTPIDDEDTGGSLAARLAEIGGTLLRQGLKRSASLTPIPQPDTGATYARKIDKSEADLDWHRPAIELWRTIRAFNPAPGVRLPLREEVVKVWSAAPVPDGSTDKPGTEPGDILGGNADGVVVATGRGALNITSLQRPGGRRISARDYLNARPL